MDDEGAKVLLRHFHAQLVDGCPQLRAVEFPVPEGKSLGHRHAASSVLSSSEKMHVRQESQCKGAVPVFVHQIKHFANLSDPHFAECDEFFLRNKPALVRVDLVEHGTHVFLHPETYTHTVT